MTTVPFKKSKTYYGSGSKILEALKMYGKENFQKEILIHVDNKEELAETEVNLIKEYNSTDPTIGYNILKESMSDVISGSTWYYNPETGQSVRRRYTMPSPWLKGQKKKKPIPIKLCPCCNAEFIHKANMHCSMECSRKMRTPSNIKPRVYSECIQHDCDNMVENTIGSNRIKKYCSKSCASKQTK